MAFENDVVDSTKRGLNSQRLLQDINTVFLLLDLLNNVVQMTLCRFQSFESICLYCLLHIHIVSYPTGEGYVNSASSFCPSSIYQQVALAPSDTSDVSSVIPMALLYFSERKY